MSPRIGSLCTGYGGLDMAAQEVFGGEVAWVSDIDQGASKILAHRYPDAPNLGDLKTTNWAAVEPVDMVCAGYPCQPFSNAGLQKGIEDERHIWPWIVTSLRVLRPRVAIFENVAGHLRRGFNVVLADLAELGFDVEWEIVRATDVGAPHIRKRLIILATAQDADGEPRFEAPRPAPGQAQSGRSRADVGGRGGTPAADASDLGHERGGETRNGRPGPADSCLAVADAERGAGRIANGHSVIRGRQGATEQAGMGDWGPYGPAIARWEHVLGRPAPRATEPGRTGERLSPAFVEFLMGLPAGHVTDVPGLSRNQQLHALGNGVVPQQAAHALRLLRERARQAVASC